mgnify:FL=1
MSAPDTDTETQKKSHRHAIRGIKTAIIVGAFLMIAGIVIAIWQSTAPEPRTAVGAEVEAGAETETDLQE